MKWAELVFWGSLGLAIYAGAFYPLLIGLLSGRWRGRAAVEFDPQIEGRTAPSVTLIIAARGEEHVLVQKLRNSVALDYPFERLQILVTCDGERDLTGLVAQTFGDPRVHVVPCSGSGPGVLDDCVTHATGDLVLFSDARAMLQPDALRRLVRHFRDPAVGVVVGRVMSMDAAGSRIFDGLSSKLGNLVRRCETRLEPRWGLCGEMAAMRKKIVLDVRPAGCAVTGDSVSPPVRVLYDETAVATGIVRNGSPDAGVGPPLDSGHGWMISAFRSHRALRTLCPALLIAAFVSNACLAGDRFYLRCLLFHELFYLAALTVLFFALGRRAGRLLLPREASAAIVS